jgi:hypothetical protein
MVGARAHRQWYTELSNHLWIFKAPYAVVDLTAFQDNQRSGQVIKVLLSPQCHTPSVVESHKLFKVLEITKLLLGYSAPGGVIIFVLEVCTPFRVRSQCVALCDGQNELGFEGACNM